MNSDKHKYITDKEYIALNNDIDEQLLKVLRYQTRHDIWVLNREFLASLGLQQASNVLFAYDECLHKQIFDKETAERFLRVIKEANKKRPRRWAFDEIVELILIIKEQLRGRRQ